MTNDEKDMTSVDGTMQYLKDIGVNLENAQLFVACEVVKAPALGELSREAFVAGWSAVGYATIRLTTLSFTHTV